MRQVARNAALDVVCAIELMVFRATNFLGCHAGIHKRTHGTGVPVGVQGSQLATIATRRVIQARRAYPRRKTLSFGSACPYM